MPRPGVGQKHQLYTPKKKTSQSYPVRGMTDSRLSCFIAGGNRITAKLYNEAKLEESVIINTRPGIHLPTPTRFGSGSHKDVTVQRSSRGLGGGTANACSGPSAEKVDGCRIPFMRKRCCKESTLGEWEPGNQSATRSTEWRAMALEGAAGRGDGRMHCPFGGLPPMGPHLAPTLDYG